MLDNSDEFWMRMAIDAAKEGKTPFGAVLVDMEGQQVVGFNTTVLDGPTAHAEMNVIKRMKELDYNTPEDLTLYSTVEPCPMCMSAIIWAKIGAVTYGVSITEASNYLPQIAISARTIAAEAPYAIILKGGIMQESCLDLLKDD